MGLWTKSELKRVEELTPRPPHCPEAGPPRMDTVFMGAHGDTVQTPLWHKV